MAVKRAAIYFPFFSVNNFENKIFWSLHILGLKGDKCFQRFVPSFFKMVENVSVNKDSKYTLYEVQTTLSKESI